eukprot:365197-Chlamydomonas_euryale.AAC.1
MHTHSAALLLPLLPVQLFRELACRLHTSFALPAESRADACVITLPPESRADTRVLRPPSLVPRRYTRPSPS